MQLSQLFEKQEYFNVVDDNEFIQKGVYELQACYSINLNLDKDDFYDIDSDHHTTYGLVLKLDNTYYLCVSTGSDGYRDYRSDIFQLNHPQIEELLKETPNLIDKPLDVNAVHDYIAEESQEGLSFYIHNYSPEKALITLSLNNSDDYYPTCIIGFDSELYTDATPFIEQKLLNQTINDTQNRKNTYKI